MLFITYPLKAFSLSKKTGEELNGRKDEENGNMINISGL